MPEFTVYTTDEQAKVIRAYAKEDDRSYSNAFLHAFAAQVRRSKKRDKDDNLIAWPDKTS